MAKLLLVDVFAENLEDAVKCVECNELDDYYKHLRCDCFDIANRQVGGKRFDIFVDDVGLFAEKPIVSAIRWADDSHEQYEPMLVGNLIFANHDAQGNTVSLSREDADMIMKQILISVTEDGSAHPIVQCEY